VVKPHLTGFISLNPVKASQESPFFCNLYGENFKVRGVISGFLSEYRQYYQINKHKINRKGGVMKISDEYAPYFLEKEQRDKFDNLYRKLMGFARKQFLTHYFRGEAGGIPPSGDAYEDFVIRALIHCYPKGKPFIINKTLIQDLYNYIRRQVSRESRLKINNLVKNETYYEARNYYYNPFNTAFDHKENIRQAMIEKRLNQVRQQIVQEFIKTIHEPQLQECIMKLTADHINFEELIGRITSNSSELMKVLINNNWIYDSTGQRTEKAEKINRPCKIRLKHQFKCKHGKKYLFQILNMDQKISKPQAASFYLNLTTDEYYKLVSKLKVKFLEFLKEWNTKENAKLLRELGLFQDI